MKSVLPSYLLGRGKLAVRARFFLRLVEGDVSEDDEDDDDVDDEDDDDDELELDLFRLDLLVIC